MKIYWSFELGNDDAVEDQQSKLKFIMSHLGEGRLVLGVSRDAQGYMIGSEVVNGLDWSRW